MRETSHWYCMLCTKTFLPYPVLNDNEQANKQTVLNKQSLENKSNLLI